MEVLTAKRTALVVGAVLFIALVLAGIVYVVRADMNDAGKNWKAPTPVTAAGTEELAEFYQQKLSWTDCEGARCARVVVPIDYAEPKGPTLEVAVAVIPAAGTARGSLFVNPGGPGQPAIDFAFRMRREFPSSIRDNYDIVGLDPRGVGASTPLTCLDDEEFDAYIATDPTPDDAAELQEFRDSAVAMAKACDENSGDLARHVSTAEAARDMDIVRALLGREKLDYFGASYGTQLGATYATLFPEQAGRMVLDGAVNPEQDPFEGAMAQTVGFQRAISSYIDYCIDQGDCPLGDDPDEALDRVVAFLKSTDARPLPAGQRELTETHAFIGIAVTLYSEDSWPLLTPALKAALEDGNGAQLLRLSDFYYDRAADGSFASNSLQVFNVISCLDEADNPTVSDVQARLHEYREASPVFGPALGWGPLACSDWPDSRTPQVAIDGKGAPPILVLGTTRDPATPYESAVVLAKQLASGVLVTRDGDGHTAYVSGPECIRDVVDEFFLDGTVPERDPRC